MGMFDTKENTETEQVVEDTTETLRSLIDTAKVRYHLGKVAVQVIQVPEKRVVQTEDGTFKEMKKDGVYLSRMGDGKMGPWSYTLDPENPADQKLIEVVDQWIQDNPQTARANDIWKMGTKRPQERIKNWDNMTPDQVRAVMEATEQDLIWAMQYEILRPEGEREEIIQVIEDIYQMRLNDAVDKSDDAPEV